MPLTNYRMTNELGEHFGYVSRKRRYTISEEQKEKLCDAAAQQLLEISDLQIQMNLKKCRSPAQQKFCLLPGKLWESQPDCKRTKWKKEKGTSLIEGRCWYNDCVKERNDADGGLDHLLMLAQSAELLSKSEYDLESSDRNNHSHEGSEVTQTAAQLQNKYSKLNSADELLVEQHLASQVKSNLEVGESILPLQRKTRLSEFRRQARSGIAPLVMHENGTHGCMGRRNKDAQNLEMVHTKQTMRQQYVKAKRTNCFLQMSEGMYSQGAEAQSQIEQSCLIGEQRGHKRKHFRCTIQQQLEVNNAIPKEKQLEVTEGREKLSMQQSAIEQSLQQMDCGYREIKSPQCIAQLLRLQRTNEQIDESRKLPHITAQVEQICVPTMQMHVPSEPDGHFQISGLQGSHHAVACQRRQLRTYKRRKQLRGKHCCAAEFHNHLMVEEQRQQRCEAEKHWLQQTFNVQNGQHLYVKCQLCMQREHRRIAAQQNRARRIKQQRALPNAYKCLNRGQAGQESNADRGSHLPAVTKAEVGDILLEMGHNFHQFVGNSCQKDQFMRQQPSTQVTVGTEDQTSATEKVQIRLTELKRHARLGHAHLVEKTSEKQLDHQNGEGKESKL